MGLFSVVAIVLEEPEVLHKFASYYLSIGASRIYLYYDGDLPDELSFADDRVSVVSCNRDYWRTLGFEKPVVFLERQTAIYTHHAKQDDCDWMLVVDADEFVFGVDDLGAGLDAAPPEVVSLRMPVAEAVYTSGDDEDAICGSTWFRLAIHRRTRLWKAVLYGWRGRQFQSGLIGHALGKQFVRLPVSDNLLIEAHWTNVRGEGACRWSYELGAPLEALYVGHFDAISFDRWKTKWLLRTHSHTKHATMSVVRQRQFDRVVRALDQGESEARRLFRSLYRINPWQKLLLKITGFGFPRRLF
ncbi:glycosyltransferase family 2 protein [uncultured Albimonas sp.]|uniref:glycosyltransferase family 2 protein n=1 Tax=uncultured Albimonas sp. TaxID=1331701 RepID=UPI0030EE8529